MVILAVAALMLVCAVVLLLGHTLNNTRPANLKTELGQITG
jgi:hypothetical protein